MISLREQLVSYRTYAFLSRDDSLSPGPKAVIKVTVTSFCNSKSDSVSSHVSINHITHRARHISNDMSGWNASGAAWTSAGCVSDKR